MGYPASKNSGKKKKNSLRPGVYEGVITDVREAEGYFPGDAFIISYELAVGNGTHEYHETFMRDVREERTEKLCDTMDDYDFSVECDEEGKISLEDLKILAGKRVRLDMRKQKVGGHTYVNVYQREFLDEKASA